MENTGQINPPEILSNAVNKRALWILTINEFREPHPHYHTLCLKQTLLFFCSDNLIFSKNETIYVIKIYGLCTYSNFYEISCDVALVWNIFYAVVICIFFCLVGENNVEFHDSVLRNMTCENVLGRYLKWVSLSVKMIKRATVWTRIIWKLKGIEFLVYFM